MSESEFPDENDATRHTSTVAVPTITNPEAKEDYELLKLEIEVWKKSIDVQQHFNDIEMRIRNLAVTILGGVISAAAIAFNSKQPLVAAFIVFAGLVTWFLFYLMDAYWYHRLLKGAVNNSRAIEDRLSSKIKGLHLTSSINQESRVQILGRETRSQRRIHIFYLTITTVLLITSAALLGVGLVWPQTPAASPTPLPVILITATETPIPTVIPTVVPSPTAVPTSTITLTP